MEYVAMIGLLFAPIVCLLCAAWFYVRWQNEHEDLLHLSDRRCRVPGGLRRAEAAVSHLGIKNEPSGRRAYFYGHFQREQTRSV